MKLRNKKTGEIIDDGYVRETHDFQFDGQKHVLAVFKGNGHRPPERVSGAYTSLAELNEEWEDYNPLEYWWIDSDGEVLFCDEEGDSWEEIKRQREAIGDYFETEEAAKGAAEKLKAWKRLKDKGTKVEGWLLRSDVDGTMINVGLSFDKMNKDIAKDLDLLFGGEDE